MYLRFAVVFVMLCSNTSSVILVKVTKKKTAGIGTYAVLVLGSYFMVCFSNKNYKVRWIMSKELVSLKSYILGEESENASRHLIEPFFKNIFHVDSIKENLKHLVPICM